MDTDTAKGFQTLKRGPEPILPPPKAPSLLRVDCEFITGATAAPLTLTGRQRQTLLPNVFLKTAEFPIAQQRHSNSEWYRVSALTITGLTSLSK